MPPRVILHNAVSLDGRINGFTPDIALFYQLARTWAEDATLAGSETILTAAAREGAPDESEQARREGHAVAEATHAESQDGAIAVEPPPSEDLGGLLVIPDSRGRVRCWKWLLSQGFWRRGAALCSRATPKEHLDYLAWAGVGVIVAGQAKVDLVAALEQLQSRYGVATVRADGGGRLNGSLLQAGLVQELSLVVHPWLVGAGGGGSIYEGDSTSPHQPPIGLRLQSVEEVGQDMVWLRYGIES